MENMGNEKPRGPRTLYEELLEEQKKLSAKTEALRAHGLNNPTIEELEHIMDELLALLAEQDALEARIKAASNLDTFPNAN
jgi:hypothetical protein